MLFRSYASLTGYDAPNGNDFQARVQRMVVFGDPNPPSTATPEIPGLTASDILVSAEKNGVVPTRVTVRVNAVAVDGIFAQYTLSGKPNCTFNYTGQLITQ